MTPSPLVVQDRPDRVSNTLGRAVDASLSSELECPLGVGGGTNGCRATVHSGRALYFWLLGRIARFWTWLLDGRNSSGDKRKRVL